jgi:hypothetical protein
VLRAMRRTEGTQAEARTPTDRADDVLAAVEDYKASRRGQKIKEPPAD